MSRGQKPRTPRYFPRMKHRARRRWVMVFTKEGEPGYETYGMFWVRRTHIPKGSFVVPNPWFGGAR